MMDWSDSFWSRVHPEALSGCWLWHGGVDREGYGWCNSAGERRAHRAAYAMERGPIPAGMVVRHTCDVPGCVNPNHLVLGTQRENIADMDRRGRRPRGFSRPSIVGDGHWSRRKPSEVVRGERHGQAKIKADDVREIRAALACGETQAQVATRFGITKSAVGRIARGKSWRHV